MEYYINTSLRDISFDEVIARVVHELKNEGFGVLTRIDIKATLENKLGVDFYNYMILGACNAPFAYKALQAEDKIGAMLPCNVIVQEREAGVIEVSAVDPAASMLAVKNEGLVAISGEVREKLKRVIKGINPKSK